MTDKAILEGFKTYDEEITREYFYGYCRNAYNIFDYKYQLHGKTGLDFYSIAHEYYIQLVTHDFLPLMKKPDNIKLASWMVKGLHFIILDALKTYNKEFEHQNTEVSDIFLEYILTSDKDDEMMMQICNAVAHYYHDRTMEAIAHMIFYVGLKQKEVAEKLCISAVAVNLRFKKMMDEVVTPFIIDNYGSGPGPEIIGAPNSMCKYQMPTYEEYMPENMHYNYVRNTPVRISSLKQNEIFVFGSDLKGLHVGGTARLAHTHFGAEIGNGVGPQGQSYAIPTMQGGVETIKPYVDDFIEYAKEHENNNFMVTPIGCGLAGFSPEDIAPLFKEAKNVKNIYLPEEFWNEL